MPACLLASPQTFFGAGATFGEVLRPAVLKHQRAVVSGHDLTVGPGGCLLGGCHGALARLHGLGGWKYTACAVCTRAVHCHQTLLMQPSLYIPCCMARNSEQDTTRVSCVHTLHPPAAKLPLLLLLLLLLLLC
jgi:hypothetical protein